LRQKIVLHSQPPDLGVQLLDIGLGHACGLATARKYIAIPSTAWRFHWLTWFGCT
jgi:hypothetical protein